jgi:hypothetical protein
MLGISKLFFNSLLAPKTHSAAPHITMQYSRSKEQAVVNLLIMT